MMTRTKWMRLGVRDPADILRWVSVQDARELDDFRYRVIRGREFVSFRMVPRYTIQIGTSDIIVVAHVKPGRLQRLSATVADFCRSGTRWVSTAVATLRPAVISPLPMRTAELYRFALSRQSSLSRR